MECAPLANGAIFRPLLVGRTTTIPFSRSSRLVTGTSATAESAPTSPPPPPITRTCRRRPSLGPSRRLSRARRRRGRLRPRLPCPRSARTPLSLVVKPGSEATLWFGRILTARLTHTLATCAVRKGRPGEPAGRTGPDRGMPQARSAEPAAAHSRRSLPPPPTPSRGGRALTARPARAHGRPPAAAAGRRPTSVPAFPCWPRGGGPRSAAEERPYTP